MKMHNNGQMQPQIHRTTCWWTQHTETLIAEQRAVRTVSQPSQTANKGETIKKKYVKCDFFMFSFYTENSNEWQIINNDRSLPLYMPIRYTGDFDCDCHVHVRNTIPIFTWTQSFLSICHHRETTEIKNITKNNILSPSVAKRFN